MVIRSGLLALAFLSTIISGFSQGTQSKEVPKGWHLLDKAKDGYSGISIGQAYEFVRSKNLKSNPVIVAIIDSGIDTLHEDLKPVLWRNPKEIPGNGVDDDKNGYVDDVYGWNFIGGKDGRNVKHDSYEGARVYFSLREKYEGKTIDTAQLKGDSLEEYKTWLKAKETVQGSRSESMGVDLGMLKKVLSSAKKSDSIMRKALNKDTFTGKDLDTFEANGIAEKAAKGGLMYLFRAYQVMDISNVEFLHELNEAVGSEIRKAESREKAPQPYRAEIVKDDENDINDRFYGNSDVMASTPFHGTHVAGIIGAVRDNKLGVDGVADNVQIMMIRAVPDGDEHDKDIALAIRYAVDNGAKIVNMSFGKAFSPQKHWVDDAVSYAGSKGVLLVHAAGNDAKNIDSADNFPNANLRAAGTRAKNWITVGASGDESTGSLTAPFSNYGKDQVDVFAPGVRIYSTIPGGNTYGNAQGTSMASPVVAGTAAFLLSYFPKLSAEQLKYCIEKSALPADSVNVPGTDDTVALSSISKTGGIINAYEAAKIAESLRPEGESKKRRRAPKSTMKNENR